MINKRHTLCNRIRSVKSWLNRAESNFTNENDVQGEINLLLAEAELQHLREQEGAKGNRRRHIIAAGTAVFLVAAFWFVWGVVAVPENALTKSAVYETTVSVEKSDALALPTVTAVKKEESVQVEQVRSQTQEKVEQRGFETNFSESQVRDFVRTAGKALRSNT